MGAYSDCNSKSIKLNEKVKRNVCISETQGEVVKCHTFDEALELSGRGRYTIYLLLVLSWSLIALMVDMFGFSVVVAVSHCELNLGIAEQGILTSMPFAGAIIMAYPWGYVADTKGRRKSLIFATGIGFVFSLAGAFSPNWKVLAVLKLMSSSFTSGVQSSAYVLLGECCESKSRASYLLLLTSALMLTPTVYFCVGYGVLKLDFSYNIDFLGIAFSPWRLLCLLLALPLGISASLLPFFYESPKFLANMGKTDEAINVLRNICRRNGGDADNYLVVQLVLEEHGNVKRSEQPFFKSMWSQTGPLFKPPLLKRSLQLFYITFVLYSSNNSFIVWFPYLSNVIFSGDANRDESMSEGVCGLILGSFNKTASNVTEHVIKTCSGSLQTQTVISGIVQSLSFTILNVIISKFSNRRKLILCLSMIFSIVGGIGSTLAPETISAMFFYIMLMITAMGMGVMSSFFVDFYPTSYRGMASCLGVMVARMSSLIGTSVLGLVLVDHCTITFYSWCVFIFTGLVVAFFLPGERKPNKDIENK